MSGRGGEGRARGSGRRPLPEPLASALGTCRRHLLIAAGFSALVNILYLAPTLYMLQIYDRVLPTGGLLSLAFLTVAVVFALATLAMLDSLRQRILVRLGLRLDRLLAPEVLTRLTGGLGPDAGPRLRQAMREFDSFRNVVAGPAATAMLDAPWTPIYLALCFVLHPLLGMISVIGAGALLILAILNEQATRAKLEALNEASAQAYATQEAIASQGGLVKALGMREPLIVRQLLDRRAAVGLQADAQFTGGIYTGLIRFLRLTLQSLALGTGAWLAVRHEISAGGVIAASILLSRSLAPVEQIVGAWKSVIQARDGLRTLVDLFERSPAAPVRTRLPEPKGRLRAEQAGVRTPDGAGMILRGVSFDLNPGEIIGVVGPSGAGKTTLARVLVGALTPDLGCVRIDGADLADWQSERLAAHIGYLPQNCGLFAGTVKENIARFASITESDPREIDERAVAAATAAGAHEMILRLPQAYDTPLGPGGAGVSAGQAQRLALARALYGSPQVFVLDEPNSNLDFEGETALEHAIAAQKARGAALVVIAHRLNILGVADKLLVLRDGAMDLYGPRREVLQALEARVAGLPRPANAPPDLRVSG
ncbi:type I secretion system permease/ATPase [Caulobacter sp. 602-2]|uniref:Type I secretion system permease/ATPase n=1 Tax=Caulobacter sp. 602-2 TaxID=2710887 RepID=A0A6G4QSZ6_9CAUL|nr:type I secretion system permease/ATPase [Caulobacter sp. 602-2]NGM48454.1 type I secretion system permease/ATPase [Caulobacter sp. 602-2]